MEVRGGRGVGVEMPGGYEEGRGGPNRRRNDPPLGRGTNSLGALSNCPPGHSGILKCLCVVLVVGFSLLGICLDLGIGPGSMPDPEGYVALCFIALCLIVYCLNEYALHRYRPPLAAGGGNKPGVNQGNRCNQECAEDVGRCIGSILGPCLCGFLTSVTGCPSPCTSEDRRGPQPVVIFVPGGGSGYSLGGYPPPGGYPLRGHYPGRGAAGYALGGGLGGHPGGPDGQTFFLSVLGGGPSGVGGAGGSSSGGVSGVG